jgi:GTP-binding protein EngB required for normal cell division
VNFFRIDGRIIFVDLPGYGYATAPQHLSRMWGQTVDAYLLGGAGWDRISSSRSGLILAGKLTW